MINTNDVVDMIQLMADGVADERELLGEIKKSFDDVYDIIDLWYLGGCEFPFEINIKTSKGEKIISFDNPKQMVFTLSLLS